MNDQLSRRLIALALGCLGAVVLAAQPELERPLTAAGQTHRPLDRYERDEHRKAERDRIFRELSDGVLTMRKSSYASLVDRLQIPVYVFEPLKLRGTRGHPALVWIHGGVHGDLAPLYFPFIKEATDRGYVVVAPEYRGSTGYGQAHHDAIDYGGFEVEDCLTAASYIADHLPYVDPERVGVIGWSHGGFIALHSVLRDPTAFRAAAALVPVTNLVFRLSYKGPRYATLFERQPRIGGAVHEKREVYIERSPVYHIERLETPLLVHVSDNDEDVNFEESKQLIDALAHAKPDLAETRVYVDPPIDEFGNGHTFNRRVDPSRGYTRVDSKAQRDSWNRIWTFFEWHLEPYRRAQR